MLYRYIRCSCVFFFILTIYLFTPYAAQAALTNEELEQEASRRKENTVLVQYVNDTTSRRTQTMTTDSAVRSRCTINAEVELLELHENVDTDQYIKKLKENPQVLFAEPNRKLRLLSYPTDPLYSEQWALNQVQAASAWELLPLDQQDILVAVIDSGINSNHPDLCNRIAPGGYNFLMDNYDIIDGQGHGTAVAGVIAAETNNGIGIAGMVGPARVKILPLKTANSNGDSWSSDVIKAIDYAIEQQVQVINLSMGSSGYSDLENDAIQKAISNGISVVAAAGNDGISTYSYPASYPGVISVGSITPNGSRSNFSNYNDLVDLTAPGEYIYSCNYNGSYSKVSGTSFSTPIVAAAAAMLIIANPTLVPAEITNILQQSAADDPDFPGKDKYYGYGVVDCLAALRSLEIPVSNISLDKETLELRVGESCTLTPTVYPVNASNPQISWASDNIEVATVDANGKVTAISEGKATIIAISTDGGETASCNLTVVPTYIAVQEIVLNKQKLLLQVGQDYALQADLNPFNATTKAISWATDNSAVASVDDSGMVRALAPGVATIIAVTADGGKTALCQVTVLQINVIDSLITMEAGNVEPSLSDNSWVLMIEGISLRNPLTKNDYYFVLPAGLNGIVEVQGNRLEIIVSGKADSLITASTPVELVIRGSAFDENFDSSFAPIQVTIEPVEDCFIATAAYGSYLDPHVYVLREFRDQILLKSNGGRWLVAEYYHHSPAIAEVIAESAGLKLLIRVLITPVVYAYAYPKFCLGITIAVLLFVFRTRLLIKGSDFIK